MRFLIFVSLLLVVGCESIVEPDGKYVSSIKRNTIILDNKESFDLNTDNGAKVIFLLRHAEKDTVPKKNPVLTKEGYDRSFLLAQIFKTTRVDAVYSTLFNRTMHTVDSLSTLKGIPTSIYKPAQMKSFVEDLLKDEKIKTAVICGHSNTTPAMAGVIMGEMIYKHSFDESEYDNLLVINILPDGEKKLYKLKYGR